MGNDDIMGVLARRRKTISEIKEFKEFTEVAAPVEVPNEPVETVEAAPVEQTDKLVDDTSDEVIDISTTSEDSEGLDDSVYGDSSDALPIEVAAETPVIPTIAEIISAPTPIIPEKKIVPTMPEIVAESTNIIVEKAPVESDAPIVEPEPTTEYQHEDDKFDLNNVDENSKIEVSTASDDDAVDSVEAEDESFIPAKIGYSGSTKLAKQLANFKPTGSVKVVNDDDFQRAVYEQYISGTKGNGFTGPKGVTRIILPYSGIFIDLQSYTNSDMLGIHRSTSGVSFVEKIETELFSAFEHTTNNSFKKKFATFSEWLQAIKYPDIGCIYWGIYNVNHPGINEYTTECDNWNHPTKPCKTDIIEKRDNADITFISDGSDTDIDLEVINSIRNGVSREFIKPYIIANTLIEKAEYLPESNFKIFQGIPNLEEVLAYLKFLKSDLGEDDDTIMKVFNPLSWLTFEERLSKSTLSKIIAYKYCMFTTKLYAPVFEERPNTDSAGTHKIVATYVDVAKQFIPQMVNSLSKEDFKALVRSAEVSKLLLKDGIFFRVRNIVCPNCKSKQLDLSLDMRDILFTKAASLMDYLISM